MIDNTTRTALTNAIRACQAALDGQPVWEAIDRRIK